MSFLTQAQRVRVGRRIRLARLTSEFPSHDKFAHAASTSRQHLIKLESGQHLPTDAMLQRIASASGRDLDYFLAESDEDDEEADPVADLMKSLRRFAREEALDILREERKAAT